MTKREAIIATMRELVAAGAWTPIRSDTIRWDERELPTPEWAMRKSSPYAITAPWPAPTYDRHVFLTMSRGAGVQPILGVSPAPWIGRRDSSITLARTARLLADPRSAFTVPGSAS